ncbi:MAG: hypothetical protein ABIR16_01990 [Dokdonella sp.]
MAGSGIAVFFAATRGVGFFGVSVGESALTAGLAFPVSETDGSGAATLFGAARFATADFFAAAGFGAPVETAGTALAVLRGIDAARFLAGLTGALAILSAVGDVDGVVTVFLAGASTGGIDSGKSPVGASVTTSSLVRPSCRGGLLEGGMDAV